MTAPMPDTAAYTHEESTTVSTTPEELYDLVSDVTRTGEWSPICTTCWWDDDAEAGRVGSWFTGRNELPDRTWETRSEVVVAERGREFAFLVGGAYVRWGYTFAADGDQTVLTESWHFLPDGLAMFHDKYGERAEDEIASRTAAAHDGIPRTLTAIKTLAES